MLIDFVTKNKLKLLAGLILACLAASAYLVLRLRSKPTETFAHFDDFAISTTTVCRITDYGASSADDADNTQAIRRAIEDCSSRGGGQVVVPAGLWRTGPIQLKSRIDLHLDQDAKLSFSDRTEDYLPAVFTRFQGIEVMNYSSMIYAKDCENIAITGPGRIDGHGRSWQSWKDKQLDEFPKLYEMAKNNVPVSERVFGDRQIGLRPSLIQLISCHNVKLSGLNIENSPMWTIHPIYSENILIDGITIDTEGPNSDGIVIDSSSNVTVRNCLLETGDDSISIKSGLDHDGRQVGRPSENILIEDSRFTDGHSAIAIGSEMSGGVRNVLIRNLDISKIDQGIRIKSSPERGGRIENIRIEDISMRNMENALFEISLDYESDTVVSSADNYYPVIRDIQLDRISAYDVEYAIRIIGLDELPIQGIRIDSFAAQSVKGISLKNVRDISLKNISGITVAPGSKLFNLENSHNVSIEHPSCDRECFNFSPKKSTDVIVRRNWFQKDTIDYPEK